MKNLPELQETKFNSRAGKETPVLRVYTTKRGGIMYFIKIRGNFKYMCEPYFFWTFCGLGYASLQRFQARICGLREGN